MVVKMIKNKELFNLDGSLLSDLFDKCTYPHEILPIIDDYILEFGKHLSPSEYEKQGDNIWIHKTVKIGQGVEIIGPAIVMENAELRHNAYLRENVIIGPNSVVGNSCEIKNSILIAACEVPHFNYVGDSIIGVKAHLGAGVILSNLRLDKKNIRINHEETNLRKIGSFIGDNSQIGCNSVLCPGTVIYPNTIIYPNSVVKGIVTEDKKDIRIERL
jgi:NDP-sugar pyrophosphorylase family protein